MNFARMVEDGGRRAACLFIKVPLVRDPGATGASETQLAGLERDGLRVIAVFLEREVRRRWDDPARRQLGFELVGRQAVRAGQLDLVEAELV